MYVAGFAYMWPDRSSQNQAEVENFGSAFFHLMKTRESKLKKTERESKLFWKLQSFKDFA